MQQQFLVLHYDGSCLSSSLLVQSTSVKRGAADERYESFSPFSFVRNLLSKEFFRNAISERQVVVVKSD